MQQLMFICCSLIKGGADAPTPIDGSGFISEYAMTKLDDGEFEEYKDHFSRFGTRFVSKPRMC